MRRRTWLPLAVVTIVTSTLLVAPAAMAAPDSEQAEARISAKLASRITNADLGRDIAVAVIDGSTNRTVFAKRASKTMRPASTMKLVTAASALATLGADARFPTRVLRGAAPGELIVQGGGDPLLTSADLRALADRTAVALDASVPVTVHPDLGRFPAPSLGPGWTRGYIPATASPVVPLARVGDYSTNPSARAMRVFAKQLRTHGLTVTVGDPVTATADAPVVAEFAGHSVREAVHLMLRESENNVAEILFRQVAIAAGQPATWAGGQRAARAALTALALDPTGLTLADGSGLSRTDRLSAQLLAELLRITRADARFAAMYEPDALPIAGRTGTLATRYDRYTTKPSKCAVGAVRGKTGTLFDTIGLSGFTTAQDGQEKTFAILVNHRPNRVARLATRQAVDGLAATINGCW